MPISLVSSSKLKKRSIIKSRELIYIKNKKKNSIYREAHIVKRLITNLLVIFKHKKQTQFNLKNGCNLKKNETETLGILHGASGETHQVSNEQTQERSGRYGETASPTTPLQSHTSAATSTAAIRVLDDGREAT